MTWQFDQKPGLRQTKCYFFLSAIFGSLRRVEQMTALRPPMQAANGRYV